MPKITSSIIGNHKGKEVRLYRITNKTGCYIEVMNYGATLVSVVVPDRDNNLENVVISYKNITDYFSDPFYLGSTIGRFANRIKDGRFVLEGQTYQIDKNDGKHSLHGGSSGFNKKILDTIVEDDKIIFKGISPDGENGFPGNVAFTITYSFTDDNDLLITYKASSDNKTPLNFTNHAYFNLHPKSTDILHHELKVYSDSYLGMDDEFLPTGEILPLKDTGFDFTEYQSLARMMPLKKELIKGYNTYFIKQEKEKSDLAKLASVKEKSSGRKVDVYSTMPGVLFYTGDYLNEPFKPFGGFCLEAQYAPDFPNHSHFKSCYVDADNKFEEVIRFEFSVE